MQFVPERHSHMIWGEARVIEGADVHALWLTGIPICGLDSRDKLLHDDAKTVEHVSCIVCKALMEEAKAARHVSPLLTEA